MSVMTKRRRRTIAASFGAVAVLLSLGVRLDQDPGAIEARYATPPSKFVDVDGLRVHYRDRGAGPAIVLLHGSNSSLFTWEAWADELSKSRRVVTLDLPGHGLTGPDAKKRYGASEMAEIVDAFTRTVGLERFVLGGSSMGGGVAWHYALLHPARVERLLLIDSAGIPRDEPRPFGFLLYSTPIVGHAVRWISPRFMVRQSVRDTYGDPTKVSEALIDRYDAFLLRAGNREATRERFSLTEDRLHERLGEIHVPTLVLWGGNDRWILPKYAEAFHTKIPGSELVVLPGLGHLPMEEDPAASLAVVRGWLER